MTNRQRLWLLESLDLIDRETENVTTFHGKQDEIINFCLIPNWRGVSALLTFKSTGQRSLIDTVYVIYAGHSISVNEDHPAQGLAVDPLYFRISILPRWQIPDQHESRTRPLRFTQNLTHVFLWICALICIFLLKAALTETKYEEMNQF